MDAERIPLFPLRTVLFPDGPLPLRIFEPRYVAMIGRCMREGTAFGVVLIREGGEVGAVGEVAAVGTGARIEDFSQLPDGLLGLLCRGGRRFRLLQRDLQPDGLHIGTVQWLPPSPPLPLPANFTPLALMVRQGLPEYGALYAGSPTRFDDTEWVGCRLAEMFPMPHEDRQRLLEVDDPLERLRQLAPMLPRQQAHVPGTGDA